MQILFYLDKGTVDIILSNHLEIACPIHNSNLFTFFRTNFELSD